VLSDLIAVTRELGLVLDYFNDGGAWSERYPKIQKNAYVFSRRG
jgi:hypothetical protein